MVAAGFISLRLHRLESLCYQLTAKWYETACGNLCFEIRGPPVEIVSKVILRQATLSATQRYLGKVSDVEAVRWIGNLYG